MATGRILFTGLMTFGLCAAAAAQTPIGGAKDVQKDVRGQTGGRTLKIGAAVLAKKIAAMTDPGECVGLMLPNANGVAVTFYRPSLFVERIQTKGVILLDEINRIDDGMRQVLLPLLDKSRAVLNPLNGQIVKRHPECVIVMSGNVGLRYTGTSAIDPAFTTRSAKLSVDYVDPDTELAILTERTGVSEVVAKLLVRFAVDVREKAKSDPDWPTVSTRELIEVSQFVVNGLDAGTALEICVFNGASDEGGTASVRSSMSILWAAIGGN